MLQCPDVDGILLVDKPQGKTSHDVVLEVRRARGEPRVGHAGTLDPAATGLLVLALGRGLKLLEFMAYDKTYEFEVRLGQLTDTDDAEGALLREVPVPSREELESAAARMVGEILQRPPRYSAVKVGGRRMYARARAGEMVEAPPRPVVVHSLELLGWDPPRARFRLRGSKGVYVRSVARDLGGHVVALRRIACGPFRVEQAGPELLPIDRAVVHLPEVRLEGESEVRRFRNGGAVEAALPAFEPGPARVYGEGRFLGIGEVREGVLRPRKVVG